MTDKYVVWRHDIVLNACSLYRFVGFDKSYLLNRGIRLGGEYPADDAYFDMNPDRPLDTVLVDSLCNVDSEIVLSEPMVLFFRTLQIDNLEFLPVKIMDHKSKFVDEKYFIMNVLDHQDCLDIQASGARVPRIKTGTIQRTKKVVLLDGKVDESVDIFRIKGFPLATLVKKVLADKINEQGFTGVRWVALEKFNGRM